EQERPDRIAAIEAVEQRDDVSGLPLEAALERWDTNLTGEQPRDELVDRLDPSLGPAQQLASRHPADRSAKSPPAWSTSDPRRRRRAGGGRGATWRRVRCAMRWLVTGGAGFLGINLVRHVLARGDEVTSLDVAEFDYPERGDPRVRVVRGDIRRR